MPRLSPGQTSAAADLILLAAIRRVLLPQYRAIHTWHARLRQRDTPQAIHLLRASTRRLRAGLRLFRRELSPTTSTQLAGELRTLLEVLGPARDADVWGQLLISHPPSSSLPADPHWDRFLRRQQVRQARAHQAARAFLESPQGLALFARLDAFFAHELPPRAIRRPWGLLAPVAAPRVRRLFRAITAETKPLKLRTDARFHAFRRQCRRMRYWTDLLSPTLGGVGKKLLARLWTTTQALGDLRDTDLALRRIEPCKAAWADSLRISIAHRQACARRDFTKPWKALTRRKARKAVRRALAALDCPPTG